MPKITFMGAGSTVFAKNVLGDSMMTPALEESTIALYDIDPIRLQESADMLEAINRNNGSKAHIEKYLGVENRKDALRGANYVINAIQVGGYDPCTIIDFEIPKKYGLQQTIADTLGVGGVFRALRTIPVMLDFAHDMEEVCPDALFINYSNPMAMVTGAVLRLSGIKTVGLCHSVQVCASTLLNELGMGYDEKVQWKIAGINHQAWLLECTRDGIDLYPEIKRRAKLYNEGKLDIGTLEERIAMLTGGRELTPELRKRFEDAYNLYKTTGRHGDMVRLELMRRFGYYITESSEHNSEYTPYFIKRSYPELIERFHIPLDEYPRRCIRQIEDWKKRGHELTQNPLLSHTRSREYASYIMEAIETNNPTKIGGNVLNTGLITNLPQNAVVEVPCLVDRNGIQPTVVGDLPEQCAALNRTNINVQLLTIEAARTLKKDYIYQAVMLDPHAGAELSIDDIVAMCDELIEAHGDWMPKYN
ncbi:MAG: alpha-glucosidase/alpha-galactosidase [Oscillospiraceae bacterium]|nr:alpha-glucosidase/alpha-galactosidase [Oscillospiraceae bacterium]